MDQEAREAVVEKYTNLIRKLSWGCLARLPPTSAVSYDDLFQEGVARTLIALDGYLRSNPPEALGAAPRAYVPGERRRGSFITYLHVALRNRYGRMVEKEWKHANLLRELNGHGVASPDANTPVDDAMTPWEGAKR